MSLNRGTPVEVNLPVGPGWHEVATSALTFQQGTNTLILKVEDCTSCTVKALNIGAVR